jgi:hypothetical protein
MSRSTVAAVAVNRVLHVALAAAASVAFVLASPAASPSPAASLQPSFGTADLHMPQPGAPSTDDLRRHEVHISDADARRLAEDPIAPEAPGRLLHRVTTPLPSNSRPDVRFGLISSQYIPNWGGYVADLYNSASYAIGASGVFTVNHVSTCSGCPLFAPWTGVGGVYGTPLIQTGVDEVTMLAWIEVYPDPPIWVYSGVRDGDSIFSRVQFDTATGLWYMLIADLTSGVYFANEYQVNATYNTVSTAEWIAENTAPSNVLAPFTTVPFTAAAWVDQFGVSQRMTSTAAPRMQRDLLRDPGACAVPGPLGADGQSFTLNWTSFC